MPNRSKVTAVVSDIHFDSHHVACWRSFRRWHRHTRPHRTVILGDFIDFPMISRHPMGPNDPLFAVDQIRAFVTEANALAKDTRELIVHEGNHDERWLKTLMGASPAFLRGALGLTLEDQCRAQGLDESIRWSRETHTTHGVKVAQFWLRHGHRQAKGPGVSKHIAASKLAINGNRSEVFGHHHRGQLHCHTTFGETAIAMSLPCMTGHHDYAGDANWQRGFGILEADRDEKWATPQLIIMGKNGAFGWGGHHYDGKIRPRR